MRFLRRSFIAALLWGCALSISPAAAPPAISSAALTLTFDANLHSRISARFGQSTMELTPFEASERLLLEGRSLDDFALKSTRTLPIANEFGAGSRLLAVGEAGSVEKTITVDSFARFPRMLFVGVTYRNTGKDALAVEGWINVHHSLKAKAGAANPPFWSLENGSYEKRPDWVVPLQSPFEQTNYLGMNASDYGGGTPFLDVWRPDAGLAIGHDELSPKLVSFPVRMVDNGSVTVEMRYLHRQTLRPGETLRTFQTFLAIHEGDYFNTLREYRQVMLARGVQAEAPPSGAFGPMWCAWGFGRNFKPEQIINALPEAKRLGFEWVTVDDGWQNDIGDWQPNSTKFPRGDADLRALADKIHAAGMKAQLWWSPMSVAPDSRLYREHRDWLLLDERGAARRISWWNTDYLCPAVPDVVEFHRRLALKAIEDWHFDGLKIDGQFLNAAPRCSNLAHHHARPEASVEAVPYFFKAIADAVHGAHPGALIELCPCGTAFSFFSMPYYNMSVASDPESSFQVRSKGKTLKALMGDSLPYFGDHVELSDGGLDFASTVGVGGVIGTEYRWPPNDTGASPPADTDAAKLRLTPAKEKIWAEWIKIYKAKMLPKGEYLGGLYDIGFDRPEAHAIRKGNTLFYAFYAPRWSGTVELRGLKAGGYRVTDYVNGRDLGMVHGPRASLRVAFSGSLLLQAEPLVSR